MYKHFKKYQKTRFDISVEKKLNQRRTTKNKLLYEEKLDIMKELFALSSTYNLIDIMFQQEIKNNILFKKYFICLLTKNNKYNRLQRITA